MRLRTITRLAAAGCLASLATATYLTVSAPASGALTQEGIVLHQDEIVEAAYGPILASNPTGVAFGSDTTTPEVCKTAAYCDVIPLEVVRPASLGPDDEYFVQVFLDWETESDPVLDTSLNDLDLYLYTDPPTVDEAVARGHTPDDDADPWISSSGSSTPEETLYSFRPHGDYIIKIINWSGVNTGYTLKLTWVSESFPTPFESLAPEFVPRATTTTRPVTTTTTTIVRPPQTDSTPVSLAPVVIEDDADFDLTQFEDDEFDDQLAAPEILDLTPIASTPREPSGAALLFWMLAAPLGALALGGAWVLRHRATI